MKKTVKITLLFSFIFLIFSAIFSFPDVFQLVFVPTKAAFVHLSPYQFLIQNKTVCSWLDATYPPLFYQLITPYYLLIYRLGFLKNFLSEICPVWPFITNAGVLISIKFPYLIAHIITAVYFAKLFKFQQKKWYLFWLLQPIPFFINVFMGQFDAIVAMFLTIAIFGIVKKRYLTSFLLFGVAGALKHIPFFMAIPLLIFSIEKPAKKITASALLFLPYAISLLFSNWEEVYHFVFSFWENQKMLASQIPLTGDWGLSIYLILYLIGLWIILSEKASSRSDLLFILRIGLISLMPYYITTAWFLQRIIYVLPLSIIFITLISKRFTFIHIANWLFFAWAIFGYPGVLDSVLFRAIYPRADYIIPLANRLTFILPLTVQGLGNLTLTAINSVFLFIFIKACITSKKIDLTFPTPKTKDYLLLIFPLLIYTTVISLNLIQ